MELFRRLVESLRVLEKGELEKKRLDSARAVWPKRFGKEMPEVMTAAECDRSALRHGIGSEMLYPDARLLQPARLLAGCSEMTFRSSKFLSARGISPLS